MVREEDAGAQPGAQVADSWAKGDGCGIVLEEQPVPMAEGL